MLKKIGALAILIILATLAYSLLQNSPSQAISEDQAAKFVLDDVKNFNGSIRVISTSKADDKWKVSILLTSNPHSTCPTVEKRDYDLLPFGYRSEKLIKTCDKHAPIAYLEEALIDSAKLLNIPQNAYGCATQLKDYNASKTQEYCPQLDINKFEEFTSGLSPEYWITYWNDNGTQKLAALDSNANLIKQG